MSDPDLPPDIAATPSTAEALPKRDETPPIAGPPSKVARAIEPAPLWLRRSDQLFVGTLLIALIVLLTIHWLRLSRWGTVSIELTSQQPREYFYSLDINKASWVEWAQLDGIGEKLAKRIVADREERGPFRDADDVRRVRGIHARQLESMKPFLRGGSATEVASP